MLVGASSPARAVSFIFTVNQVGDTSDGVCNSTQGCSLSEAITAANATLGADTIKFNIPDSVDPGVKTISPASPLPDITDAVIIDGYSQPGATENTLLKGTDAKLFIELDGTNAAFGGGLDISASDVEVQGLVINDFKGHGIEIGDGASSVKIEGNFIGTNPAGTRDQGNRFNGVNIFEASDSVVGGAPRTAHNLISGNDANGVVIQTAGGPFEDAGNNQVLGNLIGTSKDGKSALGNARAGVQIRNSRSNFVGGAALGAANTIAFNGGGGVEVLQIDANVDTSKKFLGEKIVTTGSDGKVSFSFRPATKVRKGVITATATKEATGDTSEFSAPRRVVSQ